MNKMTKELAIKAGFSEAWLTNETNVPYGLPPKVIIQTFANLVAKAKAEELAEALEKGPVNDTAASIAIWIREQ